jgi:hypothetical protein
LFPLTDFHRQNLGRHRASQLRRRRHFLRSQALTGPAAEALDLESDLPLFPLTDFHRQNLGRHRASHGFKES